MKHTTFLATTAAAAFFATGAMASEVDITVIDAAWADPVPAANADIDNSDPDKVMVRWPTVESKNKSGYDFERAALPFSPDPSDPFSLGTFTHINFGIPDNTAITAVNLEFTFGGTAEDSPEVTFDAVFNFFHNETDNNEPCPDDSVTVCDDVVTVSAVGGADEVVVVNGKKYTFTLLGFSKDGGFTFSNEFLSAEGGINQADLYARYTVAPIPLPAAGWLLLGGLGVMGAVARRRKAA